MTMQTITFTPNTDDFMNPEKGPFIRQFLTASEGSYWYIRENYGSTLVKGTPLLEDFRESDISQVFLDELQTQLDFIRDAGLKVILNFQYNLTSGPQGPNTDNDASLEWIHRHIDQLAPLLQNNVDVIACMHMGFIGWSGEGTFSGNGLDNPIDRANVLNKLGDTLPIDRMILLSTPWWKQEILGQWIDDPINQAFNGTKLARYGYKNGGWCGKNQGYPQGSWPHEEPLQQWLDIWYAEGSYLATGLEHSSVSTYSNCAYAVQFAKDTHADFVNKLWEPTVWGILEEEGCKDEILKNVGYRLVLEEATLPDQGAPGQDFAFEIKLRNEGYASFYNARSVLLVFRNATDRYDLEIANLDPRWWFPGSHTINDFVSLPANMVDGNYEVSLWLPDIYDSIRDDPRYAVRFANLGTWDDQLGTNILGQITIGGLMPVITDLQAVEIALRAQAAAVIAQADAVAQSILDLQAVDDVLDAAADVIEKD